MIWSIARAHRLSTDDASDVVQTTWLRLVEHLDRVNEPDRIGAWLATTARNECLVQLRRRGRQGTVVELEDLPDPGPTLDAGLLAAERDSALWRALQQASARCQQLLRILAGDPPPTYEEISAALDMPVGSIGPTRARCLAKLRQLMAEETQTGELSGAT
jgi:RNA polymerase sigma factor (sigma-70 family)